MDETTARPSPADSPPAAGSRWIDAALLGLLLLLAGGVHAWLLLHTRVPARDTIGYVRHALRFEKEPWLQVLPSIDQHPLYALTVLGISVPVRHLMGGGVSCDAMMLSAQLAATFAGVLLVIPTYFLGRTLFNRRVGFWSAALFQALPVSAQVTVDGLSDALFLLTAAAALAFAVAALRRRSPIQLALCGLCTGLAYLARPEGLLVAPAVLLVLAAEQVLRARRWPWRRALAGAVCLLVPLAAVSGPYIAAIGKLTVKPTPQKLLGTSKAQDTLPRTAAPTRGPLLALWWNDGRHHGTPPIYWAAWAVARETARSFQYIAGLTAVQGLWWFRGRARTDPGAWVVFLLGTVYGLILFRMAMVVGYISERHTLFLVFLLSPWAAAGLLELGKRIPELVAQRAGPIGERWQRLLVGAVPVLLLAALLVWDLRPLHINRSGHRAAGQWLAEHTQPGDVIVDPFCWAHYYAGGVFREGQDTPPAPGQQRRYFAVLETTDNPHARLPKMPAAQLIKQRGALVYTWVPSSWERKQHAEEVVIYEAVGSGQ